MVSLDSRGTSCLYQWQFLLGLSTCLHSIKINFSGNTFIAVTNIKTVISYHEQMKSYLALKNYLPNSFQIHLWPLCIKRLPAMCCSMHVQMHQPLSYIINYKVESTFFLKRWENVPLRQILNWIFWTITDIDGFVCNRLEKQFSFFFQLQNLPFVRKTCQQKSINSGFPL